ncbi:MAG: PilZ domain-containing protein [Pirellulales bacterium]
MSARPTWQPSEREIQAAVGALLHDALRGSSAEPMERRAAPRQPSQAPILITPVREQEEAEGAGVKVQRAFAKDVSTAGLGFFHDEPLAANKVIVTVQGQHGRTVSFLARVRWTQALGPGRYLSGASFLEKLPVSAEGKGAGE